MNRPVREILFGLVLGLLPPAPAAVADCEAPAPAPAKCALPLRSLLPGHPAKRGEPPPRSDDRGYDVRSYDLDLQIDPRTKQISGGVAIGLVALTDGLDRVHLDLVANLACGEVLKGEDPVPWTHEGDSLVIQLPQPLAVAAPETLTVRYGGSPLPHGVFDAGFMWRDHDPGTPDDETDDVPITATVVEPWSAHSWWPCKDHPADKAYFTLTATVPDTLTLVANGTLLEAVPVEPGWVRYRWREAYPIATYLVSIALTNYASWSEDCLAGGLNVPLQYFVFPEHWDLARYDFAPTCRMLEVLSGLLGPYPFAGEKYAQAEIRWIGAMEHQTATSISHSFLTGDGSHENLIVHELAHQWFGDSLTPRRWADIWLNEGFARYAEALWVEAEYGPEAYIDFMLDIGSRRHPGLFAGEGILADPQPILPNLLIYNKGAWVLHLLRLVIGDQAFFTFLHDYAADPRLAYGGVDTAQMIAVAELAAGRSLGEFFDPLLQTDIAPRLQSVRRLDEDSGQVTLTLRQLQQPDFTLPVPVRLSTECGPEDRNLILDRNSRTFTLTAPCPITAVQIDPDSVSLFFWEEAAPAAMAVRGPVPNPAQAAGARFDIFLTESTQVIVKVHDIRGMLVADLDLGVLPATGAEPDPSATPHLLRWPDAAAVRPASGVYWVSFQSSDRRLVRKMTLVK